MFIIIIINPLYVQCWAWVSSEEYHVNMSYVRMAATHVLFLSFANLIDIVSPYLIILRCTYELHFEYFIL